MTDRTPLPEADLKLELERLDSWSRDSAAIRRTFRFQRFAEGIAFVNAVAAVADELDHHPDIDIRYTNVTMRLSTHDAGGVTRSDVQLAERIDSIHRDLAT
jgi:4a-hydroxytetrahydrobiopterin dehydratase